MTRNDHSNEAALCPKCEALFTRRESLCRHLGTRHGLIGRTLSITADVAIRTYQGRRESLSITSKEGSS